MPRCMPHALELTHTHTQAHALHISLHTHTPPKGTLNQHTEFGFYSGLHMSTAKTTQIGGTPPLDHPVSSSTPHPPRPAPPSTSARAGLCLHLPRACSMKCPCSSRGCRRNPRPSVQWPCPPPPPPPPSSSLPVGRPSPSPVRPPLPPGGPGFQGLALLAGGYRRAAEPARWGARRGLLGWRPQS